MTKFLAIDNDTGIVHVFQGDSRREEAVCCDATYEPTHMREVESVMGRTVCGAKREAALARLSDQAERLNLDYS